MVYCKPPFGSAQHIVKYLGQYSHRVAISNNRIKSISDSGVTFFYKDYKDESRVKPATLSGVEFLRRFCMHILPKRFVKIRYYGILSTKQKDSVKLLIAKKAGNKSQRDQKRESFVLPDLIITAAWCKTGFMHTLELLPRIRASTNVLYSTRVLSC
ncbi:MAG: transposase [Bacteroidales bacterium]|nr:transposase [Bacteroidales bacterium]